jgi:hypothetical protein
LTDEIDVLKKTILEHETALKLKNINVELHSHLTGSIYWLLKYSEKYNMPLPKKEELIRMLDKSEFFIDEMKNMANQPTVNTNNNSREDNSTILRVLFD